MINHCTYYTMKNAKINYFSAKSAGPTRRLYQTTILIIILNVHIFLKTTENIQFRPYKSSNYIQFASLEFDDWSIFTRKKNNIYGQKKKTLQCKNQYILRSARNQKNKLFINYYDTFTCLSANWLNTNANKISYIILRY